MRLNRYTIHALFLLSLPVIVAAMGLSPLTALVLVLLTLLWRWALTLTSLISPAGQPELVLETISASHFVEKVRWSLDRLGVAYVERANVGTLGAFFAGRTVPKLHIRTGAVTSSLGDSPAILRYLWGRYGEAPEHDAEFLRPTPQAVELEQQIDRYGVLLQQWIYHHILNDRELSLYVWGVRDSRLPLWQRAAAVILFPLLKLLMRRAFRLGAGRHEKTVARIEEFLQGIEQRLADERSDLLASGRSGFVDISFAALSGIWVWPDQYGGGMADSVRPDDTDYPQDLRTEVQRWRAAYPRATAFVERLYASERRPAEQLSGV